MISLFGKIALIFALIFSLLQSIVPLYGYVRHNPYAIACARPSTWGLFICVLTAFILLTIAFVTNDFSITYVAANSHPQLPFTYRLTALWGGHEGSILLWILLLAAWAIVISVTEKNISSRSLTLAILGLINFCFLIFLLFTSNPFVSTTAILSGNDLNPLLQDPGFVIHPPMLYIGYVGFSAAFAITLAALIKGKLDAAWARFTRNFALAAWCFLTFGITLGSWWAYRVLGWGGFWFWDPVENASLLPGVSGAALIHTLILVEKRDTAKAWAALLALITFALSVLGTFLVRSGILISAHTFANDPARGLFLLILLAILSTAALSIYIIRLPRLNSTPINFSLISRESGLLLNSILLFIAMSTILLGTLYPLILDAFHLGTISVGAPYFNRVMLPQIFIFMFVMGFGPLCHWQHDTINNLYKLSWRKFLVSFFSAFILVLFGMHEYNWIAILSLTLSCWIIFSVVSFIRLQPGMTLAHVGFAVLIIGIMLSSSLSQEREVRMKPGNAVNLGPYQFFFINAQGIQGPNFRGIRGEFEVLKSTRHITNLYPEKRIFTVRQMVMTKVDIHPGIFRDLYIALGEPLNENDWSVRIYYKPFIRWIWFGGILMIIGGILAVLQRILINNSESM